MGYFRLTAIVFLYAPSHRQDNTYHGLCYTSCGALAGTRNSSMGPLHEGSIRRPIAPWTDALTTELHLAPLTSITNKRLFPYNFCKFHHHFLVHHFATRNLDMHSVHRTLQSSGEIGSSITSCRLDAAGVLPCGMDHYLEQSATTQSAHCVQINR